MRPKAKTVLITGSSKGLGRALALTFARHGYGVILHGRDVKGLSKVKKEVTAVGVGCNVIQGDLRQAAVIRRLAAAAKTKNASVFINNAAAACPYLPLVKISDEQINEILMTNLIVPIKLTKRIYSFFLQRGTGTIININSQSGLKVQRQRSIYCAGKWGLRAFCDTLKLEIDKNKVRLISVYPGRIKTKPDFTWGMRPEDAARAIFAGYSKAGTERIVLGRRRSEAG